jgi:hypothetical protein
MNDADIPQPKKGRKKTKSKVNPEDKFRGQAVARFKETFPSKI